MRPFVLALALVAAPVLAQDAVLPPEPPAGQDAALDFGLNLVDVRYTPADATAPLVDFAGTAYSVGFYGRTASFTGFVGSDDLFGPDDVRSLTAYGLDISVGGNVPVARVGRVEGFVPIRFQVAPRYFQGDIDAEAVGDDVAVIVASADLATGLGAALEIPTAPGSAVGSVRTQATAVVGAGAQGHHTFGHPTASTDPAAHGFGSTTLMLQVEGRRLFGTPVGAAVGYSFRNATINGAGLGGVSDVFGAFGGDARRLETSHLVHVGLIF